MIADQLRDELAQTMRALKADAQSIAVNPLVPAQVKGAVTNLVRALQLLEALINGK